jgi:hypothetical protein
VLELGSPTASRLLAALSRLELASAALLLESLLLLGARTSLCFLLQPPLLLEFLLGLLGCLLLGALRSDPSKPSSSNPARSTKGAAVDLTMLYVFSRCELGWCGLGEALDR